MACELSCCLLPRCEALRICRSGFPIATILTAGWYFAAVTVVEFRNSVQVLKRASTRDHISCNSNSAVMIFKSRPRFDSQVSVPDRLSPDLRVWNGKVLTFQSVHCRIHLQGRKSQKSSQKMTELKFCQSRWSSVQGNCHSLENLRKSRNRLRILLFKQLLQVQLCARWLCTERWLSIAPKIDKWECFFSQSEKHQF